MEDDRHILAVLSCQDRARRGGGGGGGVVLSPSCLTGEKTFYLFICLSCFYLTSVMS